MSGKLRQLKAIESLKTLRKTEAAERNSFSDFSDSIWAYALRWRLKNKAAIISRASSAAMRGHTKTLDKVFEG